MDTKNDNAPQETWIIGTGFSRGIGAALASRFKEKNIRLIHLGRTQTKNDDVFIWWDLLKPMAENNLSDLLKHLYGKRIAGFIHAAGIMPQLYWSEKDRTTKTLFWQSQKEAMQVNYFSSAELIAEFLPFLIVPTDDIPAGIMCPPPFVAHISSLAAIDPFPNFELYGGTKSAALQHFRWLSRRYDANTLGCFSIHPGTVNTDMIQWIIKTQSDTLPVGAVLKKLDAEGALISPDVSAQKICEFLLGDEATKQNAHGKLYDAIENKIYL